MCIRDRLCGKDDVGIVGQDENVARIRLFDRMANGFYARVHRLAALNGCRYAQRTEDVYKRQVGRWN